MPVESSGGHVDRKNKPVFQALRAWIMKKMVLAIMFGLFLLALPLRAEINLLHNFAGGAASGSSSISGRVTNASGVGIQNIWVRVYDLDCIHLSAVSTDASGNYLVSGLPAGTFKVWFDRNGQNYVSEWFNDKGNCDTADQITITAGGAILNINAQLAASGSISGLVTNTSGVGIQNIWIDVYDLADNYLSSWSTDANGNYTISGLPAGNLKVCFLNNHQNYVGEWYNDKSSFATADPVAVIAGSTTSNINAQLTSGGQISGRVTNASAIGIQNIQVRVYDLGNNSVGTINTDASGNYTVSGLPGGNLKVFFDKAGQNFISEWFNDKDSSSIADQVAVTAGGITTNINAQLSAANSISGRVTDASAAGIQNIYVIVYELAGQLISFNHTDASGNYTVSGLPAGNLKVYFYNDGQNYFSEWYNDKEGFGSADQVTVAGGGSITPNINAQLADLSIRVISPNGGESWQAGLTHDILWTSSGGISDVKIELSFDGGSLWSTIIASTPNDGSYMWDIGTTPSLNCVMRVSDVQSTASDTSDAPFVLTSPPSLTDNYFILPTKWTDTPFGSGGWYEGDFNDDGRTDLLRYLLDGTRNEVLLSTGSAFAVGVNWITAATGADGWHVGDFNGDGKDDILRYVPGVSGGEVFLSDGTKFNYAGSWTGAGNGSDGWYVGDYNGDGRDDLLRYNPGVSGGEVLLSSGSSFVYNGSWTGAGNGADGWYVGDYNGDGRSDLMRYNPGVSGGEVFLSDGTKFSYSGSWTGAGNGDNGWYLGRFRGTARTDIMRYVLLLSGADVFLNTGTGFTYDGSWTPAGRGSDDWHVGDYNGDGRSDLMRSIVGVTGADVLLSAVTSGAPLSVTQSAVPVGQRNARWLNDVPAPDPLSAAELSLLEGIKARMAAGEEITIYQVQKEFEKLTGRLYRRVSILKLLKQNQLDEIDSNQPEMHQE
jgi:hypothetical protein